MNNDRLQLIGELAIRHYTIRKKINKTRAAFKPCTNSYTSGNSFEPSEPPCFIEYYDPEADLGFDDICDNCKANITSKLEVNKISREGAGIRRRMTWQIKHELKETRGHKLYITSDMLFDEISGFSECN